MRPWLLNLKEKTLHFGLWVTQRAQDGGTSLVEIRPLLNFDVISTSSARWGVSCAEQVMVLSYTLQHLKRMVNILIYC